MNKIQKLKEHYERKASDLDSLITTDFTLSGRKLVRLIIYRSLYRQFSYELGRLDQESQPKLTESKQKYIHKTDDYTIPYNIVTIEKLSVSEENNLTVIRDENNKVQYTGGILVKDNLLTRKILDPLNSENQWWVLHHIRMNDPHNK
jgi:hypothetical protein